MMTGRVLDKLRNERGDLEIHKVDVLRHPRTAMKAGVTMIPTLELDGRRLSGVFLGEEKIRSFLEEQAYDTPDGR